LRQQLFRSVSLVPPIGMRQRVMHVLGLRDLTDAHPNATTIMITEWVVEGIEAGKSWTC
jgi:hypothetical protein